MGANPILAILCGGTDVEHSSNVSFYQGNPEAWPSWVAAVNYQSAYTDLAPAGTLLNGTVSFGQTATYGSTDYAAPSNSQPNYFAYKIDQNGGTYYGWVEFILVNEGGADLAMATRFALGDNGEEVTVGSATSPVPEASTSLGLLALGAGGILTRRRSKRVA